MDKPLLTPSLRVARRTAICLAWVGAAAMTAYSAVLAKEARTAPALLRINEIPAPPSDVVGLQATAFTTPAAGTAVVDGSAFVGPAEFVGPLQAPTVVKPIDPLAYDPNIRWFNGRPVRPVRTMWMTVTGYSPDARSCGESADGITATLHSVETNASRLIAADPRLLPYGSMITVPGYDDDRIAPVLDCGGAIKGRRLDLLFPTHEQARVWGVKKVAVIVWGYADGQPAEDPRKVR